MILQTAIKKQAPPPKRKFNWRFVARRDILTLLGHTPTAVSHGDSKSGHACESVNIALSFWCCQHDSRLFAVCALYPKPLRKATWAAAEMPISFFVGVYLHLRCFRKENLRKCWQFPIIKTSSLTWWLWSLLPPPQVQVISWPWVQSSQSLPCPQ